jgi:hypothetical protein
MSDRAYRKKQLMPMKQNYSSKSLFIRRMLLISIFMSLIGTSIQILTDGNNPSSIVSAQQDTWALTLQITETAGSGNTVILGASRNASDATDNLDLPEPPAPPQQPYTRAWFATSFPVPFNRLLHEYKNISSPRMQWNLSIRWYPPEDNNSSTLIRISWDSTQAVKSGFESFKIYENNTVLANLLTQNSFSFPSNGTLHQFQIIGQGRATNGTSEQNTLPVLPILLGIGVLIIVSIIAVFFYYRQKRKDEELWRKEQERKEEEKRQLEQERKEEEQRQKEKQRKETQKEEIPKGTKRTKKQTPKKGTKQIQKQTPRKTTKRK